MYVMKLFDIFLLILVSGGPVTSESINFKEEKIDLRRELDKMTQDLLVGKDPFYHSYVFNSGVGNREKLLVEWMRQEPWVSAGEAVVGWQAIRNIGQIHLLGRKRSSVTLVTAAAQLSSNGSAQQFHEHSISFEADVTSTSLFTRWNPTTLEPEVIAVVAVDSSAADLLFYKVITGKLELITKWSRYKKVSFISAVNVNRSNQLIVIDEGNSSSIDVFDVHLMPDNAKLDIRLVQSFAVPADCRSATVCRVGREHYLVLLLPEHLDVYRLQSGHYHRHTELPLPGVSQVVCFNVALQTYLAINGESGHVLRLTEAGEFVSELMLGRVSEWLVLPVSSYRSDVLLLSRVDNLTRAYFWAGANRGFDAVEVPTCDSCLEGDWKGAVSVPFQHQNCFLIPRNQHSSSLVFIGTSLYSNSPVLNKLKATIEKMKKIQDEWQQMKSRLTHLEDRLRYVVNRDGINDVTGKWTVRRLEGPSLRLSSMVRPQNETREGRAEEKEGEEEEEGVGGPLTLEKLERAANSVMAQGRELIEAVKEREKEAWGLEGFRGKVTFKSKLVVDNLTITELNGQQMDQLLHNTFRKDKPQPIQDSVIADAIEADDVVVDRINDIPRDQLKFSDGPVEIRGDVTLERPLTVRGYVELAEGGRVNGVDLSEELCRGLESCSVFPMVNLSEDEVRNGDLNNNLDKNSVSGPSNSFWSETIAGRNLTVVKINGVDWRTLAENVVYMDVYQNTTGTLVVKGKVTADPAVWSDSYQHLRNSQSRTSDSSDSSPMMDGSESEQRPTIADIKFGTIEDLLTASEVIVSELEVTGTITCEESGWGAEAADVVLSGTDPIVIEGDKTFLGAVSVTNNVEVEGTVGGVEVADLFLNETDQVFHGTTTLHGNITVENVTINGLWNGNNITDIMKERCKNKIGDELTADSVNVSETINGVPVSDVVYTGEDGITNIKTANVDELYVTKDIVVDGKVCGLNLTDFNERRLSMQRGQNISGKVSIKEAKITEGLQVEKFNDAEVTSFIGEDATEQTVRLSELHIDGDIVTDGGVNGHNLSDIATNAFWLEGNNAVEGPLIFKDQVEFSVLESQSLCNEEVCDNYLDVSNVVFKNNKSVTFAGSKRFTNVLNISEDLTMQEINGHKIEELLTKTTDQEIAGKTSKGWYLKRVIEETTGLPGREYILFNCIGWVDFWSLLHAGDLMIYGDIRVSDDLTIHGMLNERNITELGHLCSLSGNAIACKGNAVFKEDVVVKHFNTAGKMNNIEFDSFMKSVVRTDNPQPIKGLKKFSGNTNVENVEDVDSVNGESWTEFLEDSVSASGYEQVDHPVTFRDHVTLGRLSVDYGVTADTINSVNVTRWRTDAIYINESHSLERAIQLESASSRGNLSVEVFGGLDLEHDVIRLHSASSLPQLRAKAVTVEGDFQAVDKVNGKHLGRLEHNTLKTTGDQTVRSDLIVGDLVVEGSVDTGAPVNERELNDVVTLTTDQQLHGRYEFDCIEARGNVDSSEMISRINFTSWNETGVLKDRREQEISGAWRVAGTLDVKGPVTGRGRLANIDLQQLTDNITRDILDVHREMKRNLTKACEEANSKLASARGQHCKLQYLDVTQTLPIASGPSLVSHFNSGDEDFLAVSENSCITNIFKWNKNTGMFSSIHREMFGFALKNFIILQLDQLTYVLTESSEVLSDCEYSGKHLWIFMKDHFKHVSSVNFFEGDLFQGEENTLYGVNSKGMFKYALHFDSSEGRAFFEAVQHHWNITSGVPKAWSSAVRYEWLADVYSGSDCGGEVISVSVDPAGRFVAVASTEPAQVPRHADYIKVYRRDGQLFDKLPAQSVDQLQWLTVPGQTWLTALQNNSMMNFYQLQGPLLGFQLQISALTNATSAATVVLPLASKVNLQPFIILQTPSVIKIMRAFIQGDPYLGVDLTCSFDKVLNRVPTK